MARTMHKTRKTTSKNKMKKKTNPRGGDIAVKPLARNLDRSWKRTSK